MSSLDDRHRLLFDCGGDGGAYLQRLPIEGTDDDWKIGGVNNPICPVKLGFKGREPGISKDQILVSQTCDQKSHCLLLFSHLYGEVDVLG